MTTTIRQVKLECFLYNLTDAPFPSNLVAEANVTIFKIEARLKSDEDKDEEIFTEDD